MCTYQDKSHRLTHLRQEVAIIVILSLLHFVHFKLETGNRVQNLKMDKLKMHNFYEEKAINKKLQIHCFHAIIESGLPLE